MGQVEEVFPEHVGLLRFFLTRREDVVERLQVVLNAQRRPPDYRQDRSLLSRSCEDCFFTLTGLTDRQLRLRGQLEDAHQAGRFRPRDLAGLANGLADPAELMTRGFHVWEQTRWPGRNGRVHYAHTLFNLYVVRRLTLLSLQLWEGGTDSASQRLSLIQTTLDELGATSPADQPVLVRDARWLIPLAQSPATDDLGAYFDLAKHIAEALATDDRMAVHDAGVRMAAGHLRSQIRYYSLKKAAPPDEPSLVGLTRTSNALDFALLVQDLVPLLEAYEHACDRDDRTRRLELADAICQGVSPDPDLFVNRIDALGAYSMIEHLFVTTDREGQPAYTPMGQRHVRLLHEYHARVGRVSARLAEDCAHFRPVPGSYSPYGVLYGFSSNLIEHMALKALQPDAVTSFSLEDVFSAGTADTLAWVSGWRKLPHLTREVEQQFEYPQRFAEEMFHRVETALHRGASQGEAGVVRTGRLLILSAKSSLPESTVLIPELPIEYVHSSDRRMVAEHKAVFRDEPTLLSDRREGRCVLSVQTPGGWVAVSKAVLTDVLWSGQDAKIVGLPPAAAGLLNLMYPDLVVVPEPERRR